MCCYTWLIEYLGLNTRPCACEAETLPTELYTLFYETGSLTGTKLISLARLADQQSYENLLVFVSSNLCPQWSGYRCVLPSLYVGAGCPNSGAHRFRANTLVTEPSPQPHLTHKELLVIFYYSSHSDFLTITFPMEVRIGVAKTHLKLGIDLESHVVWVS